MNSDSPKRPGRNWLSFLLNVIVCSLIFAGAAYAIVVINRTEPTAQQIQTKRKSAALVDTVVVRRDTYSPQLVVLGTVAPAQDIVLSPRVRGQVLELAPSFVPGGMVREGEMLLQVDPADFENTVSIRKSELEQAKADFEIEQGRQSLAKQELELLGDSIDQVNKALVLRQPQFASIKSRVRAAEAAVERAELDLERTRLVSPFDAQVLRRDVNVGSQVGPGDDLGQLVGVRKYWVMAAIPVRNLRWVQFPDSDQEGTHKGSSVQIYNTDSWGADVYREGSVARMIGALDQQTRLARVVVTVEDPLGRNDDLRDQKTDKPPLILDTLVEVRIAGKPIDNVVRLSRSHVHDGDTVWVMAGGELKIRQTEVVFSDSEFAYISDGLESGDEVVTTTLATVADGVKLRRARDAKSDDEAGAFAEVGE
ncbi:MAG: efflux RND transporter periplasmic adaptor subunit [Aureliella sp.]